MSNDDGPTTDTTVGVYIGDNDARLIERIDDAVDWRNSSRSDWWKNAARLRLEIDDVLAEYEYGFESEREKRHWVRQAVVNEIQRENEE